MCAQDAPLDPPAVLSRRIAGSGTGLCACVRWNQPVMPVGTREAVIIGKRGSYRAALCGRTEDSEELCFAVPDVQEAPSDCKVVIPECCEIMNAPGTRWRETDGGAFA